MTARLVVAADGTRQCKVCGLHKDADEGFYGSVATCKSCWLERNRSWRVLNKDKNQLLQREANLRRKFGMSLSDYETMWVAQGGRCAICQEPEPEGALWHDRLCVDHNHATGAVRGLLCRGCNVAIGQLGDDAERLFAAACYIEAGGFQR